MIEAIGADVFNKQAQNKLECNYLNFVRELYLLLKVARRIHSDNTNTIRFNMFDNFERTNRYHYNDNKTLSDKRNPKKADHSTKTETAWTSYFKDVLAYESITDGSQTFNENNMFNTIEIERVESVSGKPEGGVNPAGKKEGSRPLTDSLGRASRLDGDSVLNHSSDSDSEDESVNSNSDLRFTGEAGRRDSVDSLGGDSGSSDSRRPKSDEESVNSDSDLRSKGSSSNVKVDEGSFQQMEESLSGWSYRRKNTG